MKNEPFLPFARPDIGEPEIEAVARTLRSGWVTTGPETRAFEHEFAAYLGGGVQAIAVNSATAGLHLALEAIGIGPGDEVIAPTLTFTATVEVARYLGADAKLVDVDATTLNIDPALIEAAITPATRAILPVHYGGLACDMNAIFAIARRHSLALRRATLAFGFLAPLALLIAGALVPPPGPHVLDALALIVCAFGVTLERWLFFAEARHAATLYYGAIRA